MTESSPLLPKHYETLIADELINYSDPVLNALEFSDKEPELPEPTLLVIDDLTFLGLLENPIDIIPPPPQNDSLEVMHELIQTSTRINQLTDSYKDKLDELKTAEIVDSYIQILDEYKLKDRGEAELLLRNISQDCKTITEHIQHYFNRPTPSQLARHYGLPLDVLAGVDTSRPPYPCHLCVEASLLAYHTTHLAKGCAEAAKKCLRIHGQVASYAILSGGALPSDTYPSTLISSYLFKRTPEGLQAYNMQSLKKRQYLLSKAAHDATKLPPSPYLDDDQPPPSPYLDT